MKLFRRVRGYRYELIAFLTGLAVMMLEIVGARLVAPHFGTSTYVWTAMIGVILGSLALGYAIGGRIADRGHTRRKLGAILLIASVLVLVLGLMQQRALTFIAGLELDLRLGALLGAILLFGPPSALIGMVSPHLAKIRIASLDTSGRSVGRLEAAGALGSIAGTFLCGYFLLGYFGSRTLVAGIALLLLATAFIALWHQHFHLRLGVLLFILIVGVASTETPAGVLADVDTPYSRYLVEETVLGNMDTVLLKNDNFGVQSAVATEHPRLPALLYIYRFKQAADLLNPNRVLVIGGGAYTLPSMLAEDPRGIHVDAAEIDPSLEGLARDYFFLTSSPRLNIINQDGRAYLNESVANRYDMVYVDAFSSLSPPFQLTTQEAVDRMHHTLRPGGVVVANVLDSPDNPKFLEAMVATYGASFDHVAAYPAGGYDARSDAKVNFIVYASDNLAHLQKAAEKQSNKLSLKSDSLILTDNFAPVERLLYR